jgi:hypothetical protein
MSQIMSKVRNFLHHWIHTDKPNPDKDDQKHVMSSDESLDQTLEDSFPASDPPGHISKSVEDHKLHYI